MAVAAANHGPSGTVWVEWDNRMNGLPKNVRSDEIARPGDAVSGQLRDVFSSWNPSRSNPRTTVH